MMRPIPKKLLIHSATISTLGAPDMWGDQSNASQADITHVRVDPSSALTVDKQNQQVKLDAVMIYDCHNSRPSNVTFEHDMRVQVGGNEYRIASIEHLYDGQKLHHIEVGLCL